MYKLERKNIIEISYSPLFISGSEGCLNRLDDSKLFKEFHPEVSLVTRNRKVRKLEYLTSLKELDEHYVKIYYVVMDILNKTPRGYAMQDLRYLKDFERKNFTHEESLNILKSLKEIIFEKFYDKNGISFLDLRTPNIKVDEKNNPILLDVDGIKTKTESLDTIPTFLKYYYIMGGNCDKSALIYMFNILTREFLDLEDFELDKEGNAFKTTYNYCIPDSIFDNEFLFEHIKQFHK